MSLKDLIRGIHKSESGSASANHAKAANQPLSLTESSRDLAEIAKLAIATNTREINCGDRLGLLKSVTIASEGLGVIPQEIISGMISIEDEKDILNNSIPLSCLRAHIVNWLTNGMPHISGKKLTK